MKMKKADVAVAIYIMAAIIMFIVPIPSWLLDILLAINISVALTILFATMFSKEVLDMNGTVSNTIPRHSNSFVAPKQKEIAPFHST